ncbi:peptide ABC transporter substrate-binding protein, partial [Chengkuizengella marina]
MKKGFKISLLTVLTLVFVMGMALVGCSEDSSDPKTEDQPKETDNTTTEVNEEPTTEQVLRVNFHSEPPTLDPGLASDSTSGTIIRAVFDGLTRLNPETNEYEPSAAEDVQVSDDLLTYTFTIRDHSWTNGDPVTAHDFEYAWKRALDPATAADYAYQLYYLKNGADANAGDVSLDEVGVRALDDKTLEVTLENPTPYFLELTAFYTYMPVNKSIVEANENWANDATDLYATNGPFKLTKWEHGSEVELVKNEDYWNVDAVKLQTINFSMVEDESTELAMYEAGDLDWAGAPFSSLPTDAMAPLKESGDLITQEIAGVYWYKFNTEIAPFDNEKMRKAFSYAINRQEIIDYVAQGNQKPALGAVPLSMPLNPDGYFDPTVEEAQKLFDEALAEMGLSSADELPPIVLNFNTSEGHQKIAQAIQEQWNQAFGIQVTLENVEWGVYIDKLHEGDYQIGR